MTVHCTWLRTVRNALLPISAAVAILGWNAPASAFLLEDSVSCHPGEKWNVSHPVKVRVLDDSVSDYARLRGASVSDVRDRMDRDIDAVIKLYNAVAGSRLVLEKGSIITGDKDLNGVNVDDFGDQTIVIGFTNETFGTKEKPKKAEAETERSPDQCTIKRVHIRFRKNDDPAKQPFIWVFGPPDDYKCNGDCRSFSTKDQPRPSGSPSEYRTFLGILTHEMGHAVGLDHPDDDYALMAQNSRTWLRGKNEVLHTQLLPDDTAGVLALYGGSNDRIPLDISATNTWYESEIQQCAPQMDAVKKASAALEAATGGVREVKNTPNQPGGGGGGSQDSNQDKIDELLRALTEASNALQDCKDDHNAMQLPQCLVSSRADVWVNSTKGATLCGVNADHSTFPKVSNRICPGKQIQLRYALNNHTKLREVLVKTEVWFSSDMTLNTTDGSDVQSPDVPEFTIPAASSAPIGQFYRLPAKVPADAKGQTYVFVRAVPYDPQTKASLLDTEADQFNNAVMTPDVIKVDAAACS